MQRSLDASTMWCACACAALMLLLHPPEASAQAINFGMPLDGLVGDNVHVFNDTPNTTFTYVITHSDPAILGVSLSSSGPWTETVNVTVTTDAAGNGVSTTWFTLGEAVGTAQQHACRMGVTPPCGDQVNFTVVTVDEVTLIAINRPLDSNPAVNPGGGLRMFPDRDHPADTANTVRVRVRARLTAAVANITVYFRSFDVDDPSTNDTAVDPDGAGVLDNRGTPRNGLIGTVGGSGSSATIVLNSDANGIAEADLQVSRFAGDNYRVATAVRAAVISGITAAGTELRDGAGTPLPTVRAKSTPMLTVWRRVHIERDSMGPASGNATGGQVVSASSGAAGQSVVLVLAGALTVNQYENGILDISGIGAFPIVQNSVTTFTVQGSVPSSAAGMLFSAVDDDDFDSDDNPNNGDTGDDVVAPTAVYSKMQPSDLITENAFARAYIKPVWDGGGGTSTNHDNGSVVFAVNVDTTANAPIETQISAGRGSTAELDDFWVGYFQDAYQPGVNRDVDPDVEPQVGYGVSPNCGCADTGGSGNVPRGSIGSLTFVEVLRDRFDPLASVDTAAHELGHQFGLLGDGVGNQGIMNGQSFEFIPAHINILRWRVKSPGE